MESLLTFFTTPKSSATTLRERTQELIKSNVRNNILMCLIGTLRVSVSTMSWSQPTIWGQKKEMEKNYVILANGT